MDHSRFIARVMGTYYLIMSMIMFFDMPLFLNNIRLMLVLPVLIFIVGIFTLILGVILVISHSKWHLNWSILITILSWLVLFKGIALILYPQIIQHYSLAFASNLQWGYLAAAFMLVLGLLLVFLGFKRDKR